MTNACVAILHKQPDSLTDKHFYSACKLHGDYWQGEEGQEGTLSSITIDVHSAQTSSYYIVNPLFRP